MRNPLVIATQKLESATHMLSKLGIDLNAAKADTVIANIVEELKDVDQNTALVLGKVLESQDTFAQKVHELSAAVQIYNNQEVITNEFTSILGDAEKLQSQEFKGGPNIIDKVSNSWMNLSRGSIPKRFNKIETAFVGQIKETDKALHVENLVLSAYMDMRGALQASHVAIQRIYEKQITVVNDMNKKYTEISDSCKEEGIKEDERMTRIFKRDEYQRAYKTQIRKFDLLKRLHETISISANATDSVIASLNQTHEVKQQLLDQSIIFYVANRNLFASTKVTIQAQLGTQQGVDCLTALTSGTNQCLRNIAEMGTWVNEEAIKLAHGPTIRAEEMKCLVDSITKFVDRSAELTKEARLAATAEHNKITAIVRDGKNKMAEALDKQIRTDDFKPVDIIDLNSVQTLENKETFSVGEFVQMKKKQKKVKIPAKTDGKSLV